ncbi:putative lipoprotein [Bordetella pertussis STO1-CHOC-0019]|nr:putative lipoprotein [Bordetella pertussis STO1-CHOC-0019]
MTMQCKNKISVGLILLACGVLAGCMGDHDPYAGYAPAERAKIEADDNARLAAFHQQFTQEKANNAALETVADEMLAYRMRSGDTSLFEGVRVRGDFDRFDGQMSLVRDAYTHKLALTYHKGTYHSSPASTYLGPASGLNQAPAGFNGQYQGDFNMFLQAPSKLDQELELTDPAIRTGSYVMIGTFVRHDGVREPGIYVANFGNGNHALKFTRATPAYLAQMEQRYADQVASFRESERQRRQAEASGGGDGFGALLALGLGGLILSSADIPGADVAQIGAALFQDVMTDGQTQARRHCAKWSRRIRAQHARCEDSIGCMHGSSEPDLRNWKSPPVHSRSPAG